MNDVWQMTGILLLLAASGIRVARLAGQGRARLAGMVIVPVMAFFPLGGTSTWLWLRGVIGDLSVLSVVLLANYIVIQVANKAVLDNGSRRVQYGIVLVAGLILYPAMLGLSLHDPYLLGYGVALAMVLLGISLLLWFRQQQLAAVMLAVVVLADQAQLMTSINTWDYLLDPLVWVISPFMLVRLRPRA